MSDLADVLGEPTVVKLSTGGQLSLYPLTAGDLAAVQKRLKEKLGHLPTAADMSELGKQGADIEDSVFLIYRSLKHGIPSLTIEQALDMLPLKDLPVVIDTLYAQAGLDKESEEEGVQDTIPPVTSTGVE